MSKKQEVPKFTVLYTKEGEMHCNGNKFSDADEFMEWVTSQVGSGCNFPLQMDIRINAKTAQEQEE